MEPRLTWTLTCTRCTHVATNAAVGGWELVWRRMVHHLVREHGLDVETAEVAAGEGEIERFGGTTLAVESDPLVALVQHVDGQRAELRDIREHLSAAAARLERALAEVS